MGSPALLQAGCLQVNPSQTRRLTAQAIPSGDGGGVERGWGRKKGAKFLAWKFRESSSKRGLRDLYLKPTLQVKSVRKMQMFRERAPKGGRGGVGGCAAEGSHLWVELLHFSACQFT